VLHLRYNSGLKPDKKSSLFIFQFITPQNYFTLAPIFYIIPEKSYIIHTLASIRWYTAHRLAGNICAVRTMMEPVSAFAMRVKRIILALQTSLRWHGLMRLAGAKAIASSWPPI